ncbi:MAG: FliA/WhiG family RNA polymerase sigma factor [Oligoflexia bacterium]|nr:FliA/WhiG family RNA polymerase sigma factor [Oligoflexia bacterium]
MRLNQGIQKYRESESSKAKGKAATAASPAKSSTRAGSKKKGEPTELERLEAAVEAVREAEEAAREEAAIQKEIAEELAREQAQTDALVRGDISPVNAPRERLVSEYAPLIKYIAQKIAARLPANIELDDLISSGVIGLMDAIEKYDATRDNKFKTYAEFRIRGAILDELRAQDWVPRSVREKAKVLERCYAKIEQQKGRQATDEEVCTELGISQNDFHDLLNQVRSVSLLSYDDISNFSKADKRSLHGYGESGSKAPTPFSEVNVASIKRLIAQAIQDLPEKQRLVLSLYYYEDLNLKEIGRVLDVTESRVSQLHTQAVLRLKSKLRAHWDEFATVFG